MGNSLVVGGSLGLTWPGWARSHWALILLLLLRLGLGGPKWKAGLSLSLAFCRTRMRQPWTHSLCSWGGADECCSGLQAGNTKGRPVWPGMAPGDLVWPASANYSLVNSWPASAQCVAGVQQGLFVPLGSGPLPGLGEATGCENLVVSQKLGLLFSPPAFWYWMLHSEPPSGHKERPRVWLQPMPAQLQPPEAHWS